MLHLTKLAVGVRDTDHLRELQAERMRDDAPLRHRTRNFPRRRAEVLDGGSMYWVISGTMMARQRYRRYRRGSAGRPEPLHQPDPGPGGGGVGRSPDTPISGLALPRS